MPEQFNLLHQLERPTLNSAGALEQAFPMRKIMFLNMWLWLTDYASLHVFDDLYIGLKIC